MGTAPLHSMRVFRQAAGALSHTCGQLLSSCPLGPKFVPDPRIWAFTQETCDRSSPRESTGQIACQMPMPWWTLNLPFSILLTYSLLSTGDNLTEAVHKYGKEHLPDALALVDIESSFSKLVGNKLAAALDLRFLRLVAHVVIGETLICCIQVLAYTEVLSSRPI